jgi:8-oxo-dGTP pyrophosphatase MutT (NUDIX family)
MPVSRSVRQVRSQTPVVAAVVTSPLGVLIGRRVDGLPLWAFIGGKIEPGETAGQAAVREVREETGLAVQVIGLEIGRRVHPATGRPMIYAPCQPTGDLGVRVCDPSLAEVRWIDLDEVPGFLPGLFQPVLEYLHHTMP